MENANKRIEEIRQFGYDLDFGDVFSHAFTVYKKIALMAGVVLIALTGVFLVIGLVCFGILSGAGSFTTLITGIATGGASILTTVTYVVVISVASGLIAPLYAGVINMAYLADANLEYRLGDSFQFYKGRYFMPLFISTLIISISTTIISQIGQTFHLEVISFVGLVIITLLTVLTTPLIIFGNLNALEAIKGSVVVVLKKIWVIVGLIIVAYICSMLGFIALCIGIIFTLPFIFAMYYSIYVHSVGIDEKSEIDEIGSQDVDIY